jgi:histidinol phosphatase-like enzyme
MLLRAAEEMDIDLSGSYMIGDMPKDVEAGIRAGAKGILVKTGYKIDPAHSRKADYIAEDIADAVEWIMKDLKR